MSVPLAVARESIPPTVAVAAVVGAWMLMLDQIPAWPELLAIAGLCWVAGIVIVAVPWLSRAQRPPRHPG